VRGARATRLRSWPMMKGENRSCGRLEPAKTSTCNRIGAEAREWRDRRARRDDLAALRSFRFATRPMGPDRAGFGMAGAMLEAVWRDLGQRSRRPCGSRVGRRRTAEARTGRRQKTGTWPTAERVEETSPPWSREGLAGAAPVQAGAGRWFTVAKSFRRFNDLGTGSWQGLLCVRRR